MIKELINIQSELKAPKNLVNHFGKYNYRNAEGIMEAVKPLLAKYGCYLTVTDDIQLIGNRYYVTATATLVNGEGETISVTAKAREDESKKGMDGSQLTGATSSYARKYALNGLFLIDDCKDPDTDEFHKQTNQPQKQQAQLPPLPQAIINEVMACTSRDQLAALCRGKYKDRMKDPQFVELASAKGKEFAPQNA